VKVKNLYRLGALICSLRTARQMKQIVVAAEAQLAETRLNAIERGRVVGPAPKFVEQIGRALQLDEPGLAQLRMAAAHDRCMREISRNWTDQHQLDLLAAALDAARVLSGPDSQDLTAAIRRLVATREGLTAFRTQAEVAMT